MDALRRRALLLAGGCSGGYRRVDVWVESVVGRHGRESCGVFVSLHRPSGCFSVFIVPEINISIRLVVLILSVINSVLYCRFCLP